MYLELKFVCWVMYNIWTCNILGLKFWSFHWTSWYNSKWMMIVRWIFEGLFSKNLYSSGWRSWQQGWWRGRGGGWEGRAPETHSRSPSRRVVVLEIVYFPLYLGMTIYPSEIQHRYQQKNIFERRYLLQTSTNHIFLLGIPVKFPGCIYYDSISLGKNDPNFVCGVADF